MPMRVIWRTASIPASLHFVAVDTINGSTGKMWLPTPVYESLPYVYVVVGLLFITGATYIGIETGESSIYLGAGTISVLSGVLVYMRRATARAQKRKLDAQSPDTQTGERVA